MMARRKRSVSLMPQVVEALRDHRRRHANVPSALKELRYTETPVEPIPDQISLYDALFSQVYQHMYPSLRAVHHAIHRLHTDR
jgi:hypothetical protein